MLVGLYTGLLVLDLSIAVFQANVAAIVLARMKLLFE
jgi:hypothetical protein